MVNAYVATEAGMQGAVLIGSMSTGILNMRPALFEQFKALMTEAMTALVLADHFLRHRGQCG